MEPMDKVILQQREVPCNKVPQPPLQVAGEGDEGILKDYLHNSSFPVARYVLGSDLRHSLRLFWVAVGLCLVAVFSFTVTVCIERLKDPSNVFVGEAERPLPIWSIPFPALTLCPTKKQTCTGENIRLEQLCEKICWEDNCTQCAKLLDPVRTDRGLCYTFNAVAGNEIFNNVSITNVRHLSNVTRLTENWDFLRGLQLIHKVQVKEYPRAAQDISGRYRLRIFTLRELNESSCPTPSLDAYIHSPIDFPFKPNKPTPIPAEQGLVLLTVYPKLVRSQRYLRYFTSSATGCISQLQNPLKYFTIYTQANCEMECHTNFFLQMRRCVLDHMPRAPNTSLCNGTSKYFNVYNKNTNALLRAEKIPRSHFFRWKCNCLPACVEFRYSAEVSQDLVSPSNDSEPTSTQLVVEFAEDHFYPLVRVVRYGWIDFLANFGGLIALFLGVSIVSLLEVFFFCLVKPAVVR
ncbi:AGAP011433-PA-like protein [Anopheles sinensis]|uniref:AGAP011433-PA-like protein n=1 Tax=Anopheles sinensis TaxID=74873 RepID=A0A084VIH4_ANOSI|nr:AGAP011433-PA-like protein [Anopheles sinensis]